MLKLLIMYINCDHAEVIAVSSKKKLSIDTVNIIKPVAICTVCKCKLPDIEPKAKNAIEKWFKIQDTKSMKVATV